MIICSECGSANEDGARFCGNCSAYLEWVEPDSTPTQGEPVTVPAMTATVAEQRSPTVTEQPAPTDGTNAPVSEVTDVLGLSPAVQAPPTQAMPADTPAGEVAPPTQAMPADTPAGEVAPPTQAMPADTPAGEVAPPELVPKVHPTADASSIAPPQRSQTTPPAEDPSSGAAAAADAEPMSQAAASPMPAAADPLATPPAREETAKRAAAAAMRKPVKPGAPVTRSVPAAAGTTAAAATATTGAARQPSVRKPGEAAPRRPTSSAPVQEELAVRPGDLLCGQCGAGNDPARKFCRRCGASLETAAVATEQLPWWKRIFRRAPKTAQAAGSRPTKLHADAQRRANRTRRWVTTLVLVAGVGALIWWLRPLFGGGVDWVQDHMGEGQKVPVTSVKASDSARGHSPKLTIDGNSTTFWAPPPASKVTEQYLQYHFDEPFRLVNLVLIPGVSDSDQDQFAAQGRPRSVEVTVRPSKGESTVKSWNLPDQVGQRVLYLGVDDVVDVRIRITDVTEGVQGRLVAVADTGFFTRG